MGILKLHAKFPNTFGHLILTKCKRSVLPNQIAALETGVTCRQCQKIIEFEQDQKEYWKLKQQGELK